MSAIHESARLILWLENKMNQLIDEGRLDDRFHPPHSSLHVGQINAGIAPNVIADKASFFWDVRVIPMDDARAIIEEFKVFCKSQEEKVRERFPGFKIQLEEHHPPVPPLDTNAEDSIVSLVKKISGNHEWNTVSYAAEAGQFSLAGFETIICGPGDIAQAHRANEFIEKEQLEKGVVVLQNLVKELSK